MDAVEMKALSKKNIVKAGIVLWIILWANFIIRDLVTHGELDNYAAMAGMSPDERRAYTYGGRLYGFLKFAKAAMPKDATCEIRGVKPLSIAHRRAVYYLYPILEQNGAEYVLFFDEPGRGTGVLKMATGEFFKWNGEDTL